MTSTPFPPPIERPRDIRPFADRPCELLTPPEAEGLGVGNEALPSVARFSAVTCNYYSDNYLTELSLTPYPEHDVLGVALEQEFSTLRIVSREEIDGLPVVARQLRRRSTLPDRFCELTVRTAPGEGLEVLLFQDDAVTVDVCDGARAAAEIVVERLPPLPE